MQSWGSEKVVSTASSTDDKEKSRNTGGKSAASGFGTKPSKEAIGQDPSQITLSLVPQATDGKHTEDNEECSISVQSRKQTCSTLNTETSKLHSEQEQKGNTNAVASNSNQDDHEEVVIRRVGFVFLAYNVEYWCESQCESILQ